MHSVIFIFSIVGFPMTVAGFLVIFFLNVIGWLLMLALLAFAPWTRSLFETVWGNTSQQRHIPIVSTEVIPTAAQGTQCEPEQPIITNNEENDPD